MKHTVIVSDVHLCQAVPGDGLWMRYRQRRFSPDTDLAALFDRMRTEVRGDGLSLVCNGDLFDFDAPAVIDGAIRFDATPHTEADAVEALARILDDHGEFVDALGRVLADGHEIVFVSGNHDAQLSWPAVRTLLAQRLDASACRAGASPETARVVFRAWFHRTSDGIHIEHGNQYDHYCSFRYPMEPFTVDGRAIQPTMGSLSFRHLVARMGFFNPHVDSTFMLSLPQYLTHWARYYARSPHSLAGAWGKGAWHIVREILRHRQAVDPARAAHNTDAAAQETGIAAETVACHATLFAPPSDEAPMTVLRELWLDRLGIAAACAAVVGGAFLGGPLVAAKLSVAAVGAFAAYEIATPKPTLAETSVHVSNCQRGIAALYKARGVVFGHTHLPEGNWHEGVFFGNSGTWSASYRDVECTQPVHDAWPLIWLRSSDGRLEGGLYRWRAGTLFAEPIERPALTPGLLPTTQRG